MEPATIASLINEVYKVGGVVLVLLLLGGLGCAYFGKFLISQVNSLSARVAQVESEKTQILVTHLKDNTSGLHEIADQTKRQTDKLEDVVQALRARPCLIDTGTHPTLPTLPRVIYSQRHP